MTVNIRHLALGLLVIFGAAANAQMPSMTITDKFMLYMKPEVKKELKPTKEQDKNIQVAIQDAAKKMEEGGAAVIDLSNLFKPMNDALLAQLNEPQKARLDEIYLQYNGAAVLRFADRADQFHLTDEQKSAIQPLNSQLDSDVMAAMRSGGSDSLKKARALGRTANDAILAKLTSEQRLAWTSALGKELKIKG